jgi:hypothetical protein
MSIQENLERIKQEVEAEHPGTSLGDRLMGEALLALFAGVHSTEWKTLMKNFADADDPRQLARLTFNDPQGADAEVRKNALHVAALAACGAATITRVSDYVDPAILDMTLACEPGPDTGTA